ncbi:MAG: GIY-YIG nuclease family protein [Candidatus Omnitrophica bacterium]|nr:GIY-YIG nuclease family protein [Candidatus Omnitrophota bacterium]
MIDKTWFVYIAECRDGTFYTGISLDLERRIKEHNYTNKCRYTCFRKPLILRYSEICENYGSARKREVQITGFSRKKKMELMAGCKISRSPSVTSISSCQA